MALKVGDYTRELPNLLEAHPTFTAGGWKRKGKPNFVVGAKSGTQLTLKIKAVPKRQMEPYQRFSPWIWTELAITLPEASKLLGEKPSTPVFTGYLRPVLPPNTGSGWAWTTVETDPQTLANDIAEQAARLAPLLNAIRGGWAVEALAWMILSRALAYNIPQEYYDADWPTPAIVFSPACHFWGSADRYDLYSTALLQRQEWARAKELLASADPHKREPYVSHRKRVLEAVEDQERQGLEPTPLDERALEAQT